MKQDQNSLQGEFHWTVPELLWLPEAPWSGTPKGDVYSFAILMTELIHHQDHGPFDDLDEVPDATGLILLGRKSMEGNCRVRHIMSRVQPTNMTITVELDLDEKIIKRIKDPMASDPLRPSLSEEEGNEKIVVMVRACCDESPEKKPTFSSIKKIL
ncbi:Guanylate cyclase 2G [Vulpes lagopus]